MNTDHTYDKTAIRDQFDKLAENTLANYDLERGLKTMLKPAIADMTPGARMRWTEELAYYIHDRVFMDPRSPLDANPSLDRVRKYVALRLGLADWEQRRAAMRDELDTLFDDLADGEQLLDDPCPGTSAYDGLDD